VTINDTPRKNLPHCLADYYEVVSTNWECCPFDVIRLAQSIQKILVSDTPRKSLNIYFCRLREANSSLFPLVDNWLLTELAMQLFSKNGMHFSRVQLLHAIYKINGGAKPHVSFGMDENNGSPSIWGFTSVENAAIYAQHLEFNNGLDPIKARSEASIEFSVPTKDIAKAKIPKLSALDASFWGKYAYDKINH